MRTVDVHLYQHNSFYIQKCIIPTFTPYS